MRFRALIEVKLLLITHAFEADNEEEAELVWPTAGLDYSDLYSQLDLADLRLTDIEVLKD